jgi:hypothetical protein
MAQVAALSQLGPFYLVQYPELCTIQQVVVLQTIVTITLDKQTS